LSFSFIIYLGKSSFEKYDSAPLRKHPEQLVLPKISPQKSTHGQAGPRHLGAPGRLIIRRHFQPIFFKLFRTRIGLAKLSVGTCQNFL